MADPNTLRYQTTATGARAAEIDAGLRAYMNKVYALMAGAMIITGLVAYVVGSNEALIGLFRDPYTLQPNVLGWIVMFAPLAFVLLFSAALHKMSAATGQMVFWVFAAVMGLSISWIFVAFTGMSIAKTFFVTAIAFGGLSIWGYTTKKNLSGMGSFLIMGLFGLIAAMILNLFIASDALAFAISVGGVLIFAGLTAYDTQNIKREYLAYSQMPGGEAMLERGPIMGALRLYLDFLNLFMFLLQFLGNRE